jgi:hypothetical protein
MMGSAAALWELRPGIGMIVRPTTADTVDNMLAEMHAIQRAAVKARSLYVGGPFDVAIVVENGTVRWHCLPV